MKTRTYRALYGGVAVTKGWCDACEQYAFVLDGKLACNSTPNFVAACHVCNGIKSDKLFQTLDEARVFIQLAREAKGYAA